MMNKKAQITLFVIIGLVIILVVALLVFLSKKPETGEETIKEVKVDLELIPIQSFITNCLYSVGKEGVVMLGAHGGYIQPESFGIIANSVMPTESNGISFFSGSEVIPYWFYLRSNNKCSTNCIVSSEKPPLSRGDKSIQTQLAKYIQNNIGSCLANLSSFKETGIDATIVGSPTASVFIKDGFVTLTLKQTIKASYEGKEKTLESFTTDLPVNLQQDYIIMSSLVGLASNPATRFFERKSMDIIGAYGMGKKPDLPPIVSGMELGSNMGPWQLITVNRRIREILEDHVSVFTVDQTRNSYVLVTPDPSFNGLYQDFIISNSFISNPEDYTINFVYLQNWPIYVNVDPNKGGMIKVDYTEIPLIKIPISIKEFYYDVSYPVIMIVRDESAFGGEGFVFQAAMEVNIRSNQPLNLSGETGLSTGLGVSLFCDYDQRKSGNININLNSLSGPLPSDATITYECGSEICYMGNPSMSGSLTTKLPLCINGYVSASKENYFATPVLLSTVKDKSDSATINIQPYKVLKAEIKKVVLTKVGSGTTATWILDPAKATDLGLDDKANIILTRDLKPGETDVVAHVQINGKFLSEEKNISLVQGDYSIMGFIDTNLGPSSESKKVITLKDPATGQNITLDTMFHAGDFNIEAPLPLVTITDANLNTGKVTFFIPYIDVNDILTMDDLTTSQSSMSNYPTTNRDVLLPRFG